MRMSINSKSYEERRDSIRANRIITVRHRLVRRKKRKALSIWQVAATENMSLSGLLFISALPYESGDIVELQVVMSGILDIFNGYGKVLRVSRKRGGAFQVAVKYVDLKTKRRPAKTMMSLN